VRKGVGEATAAAAAAGAASAGVVPGASVGERQEPGGLAQQGELAQQAAGATPEPAASDAGVTSTGDRPVDEALESLSGVLDLPLGEQVEAYAGVHRQLQDRLADLDG
jgi:hypothetical protein